MDLYLFPTLKKGEGKAVFHEGREENLLLEKRYVSQQLLSTIVALFSVNINSGGVLNYSSLHELSNGYRHCPKVTGTNQLALGKV